MLSDFPTVRRWEDTDDILQISALRVHKALTDCRWESPLHFFRLAGLQIRRTLIELARKYGRSSSFAAKHETGFGGADCLEEVEACQERSSCVSLLEWAEFHEHVETLPDEAKEIFDLIWYAELEQEQIAGLLAISKRTVQRRWREARLLLSRYQVCPDSK